MDNNTEWIKELKVGDEIAIHYSSIWSNYYKKVNVIKITPTGRIRTSDGTICYNDGREVGGKSCRCMLHKVTPEIEELIKRRELLKGLKFEEFAELLSTERLSILREWQMELINK